MATPSPVATSGLVVLRKTRPSPPVASSTARARSWSPFEQERARDALSFTSRSTDRA